MIRTLLGYLITLTVLLVVGFVSAWTAFGQEGAKGQPDKAPVQDSGKRGK